MKVAAGRFPSDERPGEIKILRGCGLVASGHSARSPVSRLFEQFRQADGSVAREHGGLGLGLGIAHHVVQLHRGPIAVSNRAAGGAMFTVRLPRAGMIAVDVDSVVAIDIPYDARVSGQTL